MAQRNPSHFLKDINEHFPEKKTEVWFQDETRFGQKTRLTSVWAEKGSRPLITKGLGFQNCYLFGSVNPETGDHRGFIANCCTTAVMNIHLTDLSESVSNDSHIVLICDQAGWHHSKNLVIPNNISFCFLPAYSPELNPIERLWLWLKERYLSNQTFANLEEIIEAGQNAWQKLTRDHVKSVCAVNYTGQ